MIDRSLAAYKGSYMQPASSLLSRLMTPTLTSCQDKLSALQQKLQASSNASSKIIYRTADVGDYEAVDAAVASAVEELGRIDILINNVSPLAIVLLSFDPLYNRS